MTKEEYLTQIKTLLKSAKELPKEQYWDLLEKVEIEVVLALKKSEDENGREAL